MGVYIHLQEMVEASIASDFLGQVSYADSMIQFECQTSSGPVLSVAPFSFAILMLLLKSIFQFQY